MPESYRCLTCGSKFGGYGNNPDPIGVKGMEDHPEGVLLADRRVCDDCNALYVIPVRLGLAHVEGELYDRKGKPFGTFGTTVRPSA